MMEGAGSGASRCPEMSVQFPSSTDRRQVDKSLKRLHRLSELCADPMLGLKKSPPYLPDLIHDTSTLLIEIWEPYLGSRSTGCQMPRGDEVKYLRVHIRNLLSKTDRALMLFKEKIHDETSNSRRNLTKLSLLFSHMLWELKAMFPRGYFQGDIYKLAKTEADEFWRHSFGTNCIVQWNTFKEHLRSVHPFEERMESMALKSTIDLTCNDHVSVFEFDIFTNLFQPWKTLIKNWNYLAVTHPGYMAFLTYDQVVDRLERYQQKPGSYIFRLSCTRMGQWAIGHVTVEGEIIQTIPQNIPLYQALMQGFKEGCYLYPDGRNVNPDLKNLCELPQKENVKVTEEQYELYCEIGSTFQMCKICAERDKDTQIQPCGHLMCQTCLRDWLQKAGGHTCPFCRSEIIGTESILVEPYMRGSSQWQNEEGDDGDEEEDHEDIESLIKEIAALKEFSNMEHQVSTSHIPAPPVPPRSTTVPHFPNSCLAQGGSDTNRRKAQTNRLEKENCGGLRSYPLSNSAEFLGEADSSSSSQTNAGAASWMGPFNPIGERRQKEKEDNRRRERKEKTNLEDLTRTMSS